MATTAVQPCEAELRWHRSAVLLCTVLGKNMRQLFRNAFKARYGVDWVDAQPYGAFLLAGGLPPWQPPAFTALRDKAADWDRRSASDVVTRLRVATNLRGILNKGDRIRLGGTAEGCLTVTLTNDPEPPRPPFKVGERRGSFASPAGSCHRLPPPVLAQPLRRPRANPVPPRVSPLPHGGINPYGSVRSRLPAVEFTVS